MGGGEDITLESAAQGPSPSAFSQLGYLQLPTTASQSICHFLAGLWCPGQRAMQLDPGLSSSELRSFVCVSLSAVVAVSMCALHSYLLYS